MGEENEFDQFLSSENDRQNSESERAITAVGAAVDHWMRLSLKNISALNITVFADINGDIVYCATIKGTPLSVNSFESFMRALNLATQS